MLTLVSIVSSRASAVVGFEFPNKSVSILCQSALVMGSRAQIFCALTWWLGEKQRGRVSESLEVTSSSRTGLGTNPTLSISIVSVFLQGSYHTYQPSHPNHLAHEIQLSITQP